MTPSTRILAGIVAVGFAAFVLDGGFADGGHAASPSAASQPAAVPAAPAPALGVQPLVPRAPIVKPQRTVLDEHDSAEVAYVKFRDGLTVRLRDGRLSDLGTGALAEAAPTLALFEGWRWQRLHALPEPRLDDLRRGAEQRMGRAVADPNLEFVLHVPRAADAAAAIDALNAMECVEIARPIPLPAPSPTPPAFFQQHLLEAPAGIDAIHAWDTFGVHGAGVKVADIEYTFNPNHLDLPPVTVLGGPPMSPFDDHHGTAVLGVLGALNNGWGTRGIAHESELYFASSYTEGFVNIAGAVTTCLDVLGFGDVLLLEAQMFGPGSELVPVEWLLPSYNAIVLAVGNGVVVVEAAGNGSQDLDAPVFSQGNEGHWPFLPENDSGAIMIGAGDHAELFCLSFSNYGSRVNVQGPGNLVTTTGYGGLYSSEGPNLYYTGTFAGTSSASAVVAGACALFQSVALQQLGRALDGPEIREIFMATGSPQGNPPGPKKHIGPRPDLEAATQVLVASLCPADLTGDAAVDAADLGMLLAAWGPCPGCAADLTGDGIVDGADSGLLLAVFGECP